MLIAVVNQKGGVGKTTLAVHLAAWYRRAGYRVGFIDADGQASSSRWLAVVDAGISIVRATEADAVIESAISLRATNDVLVADGPANLAESSRALLLVADLAVIPCGATMPDLESTAETVRILRNAQAVRGGSLPHGLVVLNRLRHERCLLTRDAPTAARSLGIPVAQHRLQLREALADAPGQRMVVWNMGRRAATATAEMERIIEEIDAYARNTENDRSGLERRAAGVSGGH